MKITKEQIHLMERKVSRDIEIENQTRVNYHRVFKSKKQYTRKPKHKYCD